MASREHLTRDARERGLTGREASAWVSYQLAKERLSNAQDERRAKVAAAKTKNKTKNKTKKMPAAAKRPSRKPAPKAPSSGFSLFGRRT